MLLTCIVPGWHAAVGQRRRGAALYSAPHGMADGVAGDAPGAKEGARAGRTDRTDACMVPGDADGLGWSLQRNGAPCWWSATEQALGLGTAASPGATSCETSGANSGAGVPAANDWAERTGRAAPDGRLLRADPVSLQADRDSALLHPGQALQLDEAQAAELVADLTAFLAEDGLTLHAVTATDWYLSGAGLPRLRGPSPDALAFRSLEPTPLLTLEHDSAERRARQRLRTVQSELEMLLHTHPLNDRRRAAGLPLITGVHPWGASGGWTRRPGETFRRPDAVYADALDGGAAYADAGNGECAFVRCAAAAAGVPYRSGGPGGEPASYSRAGSDSAVGADGESLLLVDLSLRAAWLSGDAAALERARARFVEQRLEPLRAAGVQLAWRSPGEASNPRAPGAGAASGLRIIAEAGWSYTLLPPPATGLGKLVKRARVYLSRRLTRRSRSSPAGPWHRSDRRPTPAAR